MTAKKAGRRDVFAEWCYAHPYTLAWIAFMTTVNVVLNTLQLFHVIEVSWLFPTFG